MKKKERENGAESAPKRSTIYIYQKPNLIPMIRVEKAPDALIPVPCCKAYAHIYKLTGDIHLNIINAEVFMTTSYSIDIRKESVIQDYRGSNTETNDFFNSRMSKYDRIDNSNTSSHSSSTNHREVSETDAQSFDKVFFEDRRGTTPGGGFYIPEGRGTVGPDIPNIDSLAYSNDSTTYAGQQSSPTEPNPCNCEGDNDFFEEAHIINPAIK
jgi:hypothetical protein